MVGESESDGSSFDPVRAAVNIEQLLVANEENESVKTNKPWNEDEATVHV